MSDLNLDPRYAPPSWLEDAVAVLGLHAALELAARIGWRRMAGSRIPEYVSGELGRRAFLLFETGVSDFSLTSVDLVLRDARVRSLWHAGINAEAVGAAAGVSHRHVRRLVAEEPRPRRNLVVARAGKSLTRP